MKKRQRKKLLKQLLAENFLCRLNDAGVLTRVKWQDVKAQLRRKKGET